MATPSDCANVGDSLTTEGNARNHSTVLMPYPNSHTR